MINSFVTISYKRLDGTIISWIFSEKFARLFIVASGLGLGYLAGECIVRRRRAKLTKIKGGQDLSPLMPDEVYEVLDQALGDKIRAILGNVVGPLIVDHRLAIFAGALTLNSSMQVFSPLSLVDVQIRIPSNYQYVLATFGFQGVTAIVGGWYLRTQIAAMLAIGGLPFSGVILGTAILSGVIYGVPQAYDKFIVNSPAALERIARRIPAIEIPNSVTGEVERLFLDSTPTSSKSEEQSKIYIRNSDHEKVHVPKSLAKIIDIEVETQFNIQTSQIQSTQETSTCTHELTGDGKKTPGPVKESCESQRIRKYVPLNQRTKTLADIIHENDSKNLQEAKPYLDQYESKAERFRQRREAIREGRRPVTKIDELDTFLE